MSRIAPHHFVYLSACHAAADLVWTTYLAYLNLADLRWRQFPLHSLIARAAGEQKQGNEAHHGSSVS